MLRHISLIAAIFDELPYAPHVLKAQGSSDGYVS